jgi:hemoglobin/transferrin/lactoferrin receptor protein
MRKTHRLNGVFWGLFSGIVLFSQTSERAPQKPPADLTELSLAELADIPVVSASRRSQNRLQSPRSVSVITGEEIRRRNFRTVPEALAGVTGVFLQQTNYAGGSPILRGMVGNRILILINGVRMNNGIYRLGPNQYLSWIDIGTVERIEVLRGSGGVLYGSDAFGGVVNIITQQARTPERGEPSASVSVRTRFSSADRSGGGRLAFSAAGGAPGSDWGLTGGYSQEGFGDLQAGGGGPVQRFAGYRQSAANLGFRWSLPRNQTLTASVTRFKQFDVPRTDVLTAKTELLSNWNPQGRDMATLQYSLAAGKRWIESVDATIAFQRPYEDYFRIPAAQPFRELQTADSLQGASTSLQFTTLLGRGNTLTYGFESTNDRVSSRGWETNRLLGRTTRGPSTYADGSRYSTLSLFAQDEMQATERWSIVAGLRQDWVRLRAVPMSVTGEITRVALDPRALNGSLFSLYKLSKNITAVAGVSQGFRSPNIDDISAFGPTGSRFEVPNEELTPERSLNSEFGLRFERGQNRSSVAYFDDRYRDFIDRAPSTFRGLPFFDFNGNGTRDSGDLAIWKRKNIGQAHVQGVEAESLFTLSESLTWTSNASWTRADNHVDKTPLTRIPPLQGTSRLTWQTHAGWWVEAAAQAALAQRRLAPADKSDPRIGPSGTPGFAVLHLRAGLQRGPLSGLAVAWENITDRRYKFHGSGFYRPGSNFAVGFTRSF